MEEGDAWFVGSVSKEGADAGEGHSGDAARDAGVG